MIYDCFQFYNELDLLEIRLHELYPVVNKFIISEATKTFSGNDKELRYLKNLDRYKKYSDKITYIAYDEFDRKKIWTYEDGWKLENNQRRCLAKGLKYLQNNDMVMISDLDEIPKRDFVMNMYIDFIKNPQKYKEPITLRTQMYYGKMYNKIVKPEDVASWRGTVVINGEIFNRNKDLNWYRNYKDTFKNISNAGWHFSYMGTAQDIIYKIESYAHQESNTPEIKNKIQENLDKGIDLFNREGYNLERVEIDDTYPELIKTHPEKFESMLK